MNISRRRFSGLIVILGCMGCSVKGSAQTSRFLFNDTALYPLFEQLRRADSQVVSILHLGDSHVQAGFLPEAAAAGLKQKFGDAGPGWVLPYNLARTNGPDAYRWSSHIRWSSVRVVERYQAYWPGPGGMTIHTSQVSPSLSCTIKQGSADNIQIFYDAGPGKAPVQAVADEVELTVSVSGKYERLPERQQAAIIQDTGYVVLAPQQTVIGQDSIAVPGSMQQAVIAADSVAFPGNMQQATITADSSIYAFRLSWPQHKGLFRFYGAVLQNGHQGVLYHAIGINGAQFMHYNQHVATLPVQLRILRPQLLILSLGTNEAFGGVTAAQLRQEMDKMMKVVHEHAPGAKVLFTTPPYGMKKKRRVAYRKNKRTYYRVTYAANPQVAVLRAEILQYCRDNGYACWDFYDAMRADKRFLRGWSNDRLHFNAYGYTLQGTMLFETIAAAYDDWIKNLADAFPGKPVERTEVQ